MSDLGSLFPPGLLREAMQHGAIGVPIFFVITGFVIPYSLYVGNFRVQQFLVFLVKRLLRLEPPYLVSIAAAIVFYLAFQFHIGAPLHLSAENLLLHLGYLVGMAKWLGNNVDWYIPAFWTLQFEFQFYVVTALAFPLVNNRHLVARLSFVGAFMLWQAALLRGPAEDGIPLLFRFNDLFMLGVVIFQRKAKLSGRTEFLLLAGLLVTSIGMRCGSFFFYGPLLAVFILRVDIETRLTNFMGKISYSLYLYHSLFGLWLMGALVTVARFDRVSAFVLGVVATTIFSWIMYLLVERPSVAASKRISYANQTVACA